MPVLYGELGLTGPEIAALTPWEIDQRVSGYERRMKNYQVFMASFVTAPVINAGFRSPKRPVTARKLVPDAFKHGTTAEQKNKLLALAEAQERKRQHGKS